MMHPSGEFLRNMSTRDGYAIKKAANSEILVFVISGGSSESMRKRLEFLDVKEIHMSVKNKVEVLESILKKYSLTKEQALYMGDDIPDYHLIEKAGVGACPFDAAQEIRAISDYVSPKKGGEACVRDLIEQTLKVQQNWMLEEDFSW